MSSGTEWELEEEERRLQAQSDVRAIEAGDLICPWCQKYVDPREWWTHIDANPYEDTDGFGPTLFHKSCGARVPDTKKEWVSALRKRYSRSPIKPGDYVPVNHRISRAVKLEASLRVIGIETDEYDGVMEDDPYYVLDISDLDSKFVTYQARKQELELVGRPHLTS